jgi:hypothetical protein
MVCTGIYPGIAHELAMAVGEERDPGKIGRRDWIALAEGADMRPGIVLRLLEDMTLRLGAALAEWTVSFAATVGKDPVMDRIRSHVGNQVRRTRYLLSLP